MKKVVALAVLLTTVFIYSCKKKEVQSKPAIADIPLTGLDMKAAGDTLITYLASPATFLSLNGDYTWTIDLGGAKSFGFYTWTPTEPNAAQIKFYITEWHHLSSDTTKSFKLRDILLELEKCEFPDPAIVNGVFFSAYNWSIYLRTERQ